MCIKYLFKFPERQFSINPQRSLLLRSFVIHASLVCVMCIQCLYKRRLRNREQIPEDRWKKNKSVVYVRAFNAFRYTLCRALRTSVSSTDVTYSVVYSGSLHRCHPVRCIKLFKMFNIQTRM